MLSVWPWLKALHVACAVTFLAGLVLVALALTAARTMTQPPWPQERRLLQAAFGWNRWVTGPAMVGVWLLGLSLAAHGGWFGAAWFNAKLALVLLLSAGHGGLSGLLRRAASGERPRDLPMGKPIRYAAPAVLSVGVAIVMLVIAKPG